MVCVTFNLPSTTSDLEPNLEPRNQQSSNSLDIPSVIKNDPNDGDCFANVFDCLLTKMQAEPKDTSDLDLSTGNDSISPAIVHKYLLSGMLGQKPQETEDLLKSPGVVVNDNMKLDRPCTPEPTVEIDYGYSKACKPKPKRLSTLFIPETPEHKLSRSKSSTMLQKSFQVKYKVSKDLEMENILEDVDNETSNQSIEAEEHLSEISNKNLCNMSSQTANDGQINNSGNTATNVYIDSESNISITKDHDLLKELTEIKDTERTELCAELLNESRLNPNTARKSNIMAYSFNLSFFAEIDRYEQIYLLNSSNSAKGCSEGINPTIDITSDSLPTDELKTTSNSSFDNENYQEHCITNMSHNLATQSPTVTSEAMVTDRIANAIIVPDLVISSHSDEKDSTHISMPLLKDFNCLAPQLISPAASVTPLKRSSTHHPEHLQSPFLKKISSEKVTKRRRLRKRKYETSDNDKENEMSAKINILN